MSFIPGADGNKSIFKDGIQVDHLSENTVGHNIVFNNDTTFNGNMVFDPTLLSNTQATKMGMKQYLADKSGGANDIAYYGGNKATLAYVSGGGTLDSVPRAVLVPIMMQDGSWRITVNITLAVSSTSRSAFVFSMNGLTFKNVVGYYGNCTANYGTTPVRCYGSGGNTFTLQFSTATSTEVWVSGGFELDSKPTWAY